MNLFEQLNLIKQHSGRLRKQELIESWKNDEVFCLYLKGAFDPYITFNIAENSLKGLKEGPLDDLLGEDYETMQRFIANPDLYKRADFRAWLERFDKRAQTFLIGMLTKTPRLGIAGDSIIKLIPNLWKQFQLPLAYPVDWNRVIYPCIGQAKIDGLRCVYEDGVFRTRKGHIIQGLDCILESLQKVNMTANRLDGEIYVPGKTFDEISGKIRSFNNTPDAHYYIFDWNLDSQGYSVRNTALMVASAAWSRMRLTNISVPITKIVHDQEEAYAFYQNCRSFGFEGILLKDMEALPFTGRKHLWQKVKPVETYDLEVIGVEEGTGKYERHVGNLICRYGDTEVRVGSGLTDSQRKVWYVNPDIIIGKTVEINCMEQSSMGKLRHPRLIQVRGDK